MFCDRRHWRKTGEDKLLKVVIAVLHKADKRRTAEADQKSVFGQFTGFLPGCNVRAMGSFCDHVKTESTDPAYYLSEPGIVNWPEIAGAMTAQIFSEDVFSFSIRRTFRMKDLSMIGLKGH